MNELGYMGRVGRGMISRRPSRGQRYGRRRRPRQGWKTGLVRRNPRKLAMPLLKDTSCTAAAVALSAYGNILLLPQLTSDVAKVGLVLAEIGGAVALSNKYPCAAAGVAGGILGGFFTALAAFVANDVTLIAWNPEMARQLEGSVEFAGFPENLSYTLGA